MTRHIVQFRNPADGHEYAPTRAEAVARVRDWLPGVPLTIDDHGRCLDPEGIVRARIAPRPSRSGPSGKTRLRRRPLQASDEEWERWDRAAALQNQSFAAWAREILNRGSDAPKKRSR